MERNSGPVRAVRRRPAARSSPAGGAWERRTARNQSLQLLRALVLCVVLLVAGGSALLASYRPAPCETTLRRIVAAKEQYALDHHLAAGDRVRISELIERYLGSPPHCPAGGAYTIGVVGETPRCSFVGHQLEVQKGSGSAR